MFKTFVFLTLIIAVKALDEDAYKDVDVLIESHGYTLEKHTVTTSDEYELEIHRIPGKDNKKVILIMHQFLTSSADFVSMGNRSLAFLLADQEYDVWLGNARGNAYSRSHVTLKPEDKEFWQFTFDDIAKKDLPAIIDYIITTTSAKDIYYIGHGQGSTIFYIMASEMPEYASTIKRMVALAPMAHMEKMPNLFFTILNTVFTIFDPSLDLKNIFVLLNIVVQLVNFNEMFPKSPNYLFAKICDDDAMLVELCAGFVNLIYGFDNGQIEKSKVPVMLSNAYAGSSFKNLEKYVKFYQTDEFAKAYKKLNDIEIPNAIFYGINDWLVSLEDIDHLADDLKKSLQLKYLIPNKDFNHIDFLFGKDAKELVYDPLFKFLEGEDVKIKAEL